MPEQLSDELLEAVTFAAQEAGLQYSQMQYDGAASSVNDCGVICIHNLQPGQLYMPYHRTILTMAKIANADYQVYTLLIGVCPGGILHWRNVGKPYSLDVESYLRNEGKA